MSCSAAAAAAADDDDDDGFNLDFRLPPRC
jgi:hypothetical protein